MELIVAFYDVFTEDLFLLGRRCGLHRQLIEVMEEVVVLRLDFAIVAHGDTGLMVAEDAVLRYLREAVTTADDAGTLILVNLIVRNVIAAVEEYYTVAVVVNNVMLDPAEAGLDTEDAL